jgi:hypothetical protein
MINGSSRIRGMLRSVASRGFDHPSGPLSADFGPTERLLTAGGYSLPVIPRFFNCFGVGSAMEISRRSGPSWNRYLRHPAARSGSFATVSRAGATAREALAPRTAIGPAIGARGCLSQAGVNGVGAAMISSTSSKAPRTSAGSPPSPTASRPLGG